MPAPSPNVAAERPLFQFARKQAIAAYQQSGRDYIASTREYFSTLPLVGEVAQNVTIGSTAVCLVKFPKGQVLSFFSYGLSDQIPGTNRKAEADDTNLQTAQETNANEDMVIEGISVSIRNSRIGYDADDIAWSTDEVVDDALSLGGAVLFDPAAALSPPTKDSPFNLEDPWLQLLQHMDLSFRWNKRIEDVAGMFRFYQGGGRSLLRANGNPDVNNRAGFPEGWHWRRAGTDSKFLAIATLDRDIVVPMPSVALPSSVGAVNPTGFEVDVRFGVHGIAFSFPTQN
jgi:hypothetical protein